MATIYEVAKEAGVSISTVSRALRNDPRISERTRGRVREAAESLDYLPSAAAQTLAGSSVRSLGMVLPHIKGTYYAELAVGFERRASELNCSAVLLLVGEDSDQRPAVRRLAGAVDGLAFMARSAATDELVTEVAKRRPTVTVARAQLPGLPAIYAESEDSAAELTRHLVDIGRTRFAFVGPIDHGSDIAARYDGFARALREAGFDVPPAIEVELEEGPGLQLARDLVAQGMPYDAIVCGNDEIAVAIVYELQELGVDVPAAVSVVGWDDIRVSRYLRPGLTTVRQPVAELGAMAAEHLHNLLSGTAVPDCTALPTALVHRESCGCGEDHQPPSTTRE
ncbi:LacI family DNA-binding transcriptional regulator [Tessaracoccus oleiagri]|uniref:Transcriptional regulator, LacI family n=1 Tax=Tessaracoccus oleiagri TaxID=686624 RepID=A0A1G9HN65_9ACTN|nr:LacI family DNA-binding transcriptional regulator [Tessaracoccus oleiagri]SDL13943.1 transcriptional regulator, LacI family [Tessaracoccus oleiagri]